MTAVQAAQGWLRHERGWGRSKLSYLIYLNDDCDGGTMRFYEQHDRDGHREESTIDIRPATGSGLLFRLQIWHEGTPVLSGRKYILRTDLFYLQPS